MKILITDGNNRIALAVVRALGREKVEITCVEQDCFSKHRPICFSSKYVKRSFIIPSVKNESLAIEALLKYAEGQDAILPVSINMILLIVKNRAVFENVGISVPYGSWEEITEANNKYRIINLAASLGIPVPATFHLSDISQLSDIAKQISFPAVIKFQDDYGLYLEPKLRYTIADNQMSLKREYMRMHAIKEYPLIQEYIKGSGYGFSALFDKESNVLAQFCHKRLREYPINGGPSTFCESVWEPKIAEYGLRLLKALNWKSIAMVEFRRDERDGKFKLMEINPRFWGSLPLAIYAGVDFPARLVKSWQGEYLPAVMTYKLGFKTRFLYLDLLAAKDYFLNTTRKAAFLGSFLKDLLNFKIKDGIICYNDPWPALVYLFTHFST